MIETLIARPREDLENIEWWLAAFEKGATTGRREPGGNHEDTTQADINSYTRMRQNLVETITHLEQKYGGKPA